MSKLADSNPSYSYIREVKINYKKNNKKAFLITEPKNVVEFIRKVLPDNSREHCVALYLNSSHEVIYYALISTGTANSALLAPREIYQRAIAVGAIATIISHNHPSGCVEPSNEDLKVTAKIKSAGELIGIKLLDHVIVSDSGFYSFSDKGQI